MIEIDRIFLLIEAAPRLLLKLSRRLFDDVEEQRQFVESLIEPRPIHPCILWCGDRPNPLPFAVESSRPEQPAWVDRLPLDAQPGKHPLHDQGAYYCLDYASVLAASVTQAIPESVHRVVDLCASPGGKSLFVWRSLQPDWLLSNEVVGKRLAPLIANLKRCGFARLQIKSSAIASRPEFDRPNAEVSDPQSPQISVASQDLAVLAEHLPESMDVAIVDAPCTGQSLLAKGGKAVGCFHPVNINKNANRQKRIVANAVQLLRPGGYLAYMTCAFSPEENEAVITWLLKKHPTLRPLPVSHLAAFQSKRAEFPCYRFWPQSGIGAGGFSCLLQQTGEERSPSRPDPLSDQLIEQLNIRPIYFQGTS
ncbi:MAG: RsmB/NOP family class I SAM-dependent RNA methyltransferase [Elainellaceae cyanobacterium]